MFLNNLIIAIAVLSISHHCLADGGDDFEITAFLNIPYQLVSSDENIDRILKHLDIDYIWRKMFELPNSTLTLMGHPSRNMYTLTEKADSLEIYVSFQVGQEFVKNTVNGRQFDVLFNVYKNTLTETQKAHGSDTLVIERQFSNKHVIVKVQLMDIIGHRVYEIA